MLRTLAALVAAQVLLAPVALVAQGPVRWSGYIQARETYRDGPGLSGSINRARLSASGGGAKDVTWRVQGEFRTGSVGTGRASVALQDAFVRYKPGALGITVGQYKTPFTREFITSLADIETADRSTVVDSLAPKRDIGVMADYSFGSDATVFLGVFNGEGQNVTANADSSLLIVGRVTGRPVPFLTLGANVADYGGDSTRYGVDVSIEYMGAIFRAEYVTQNRRRCRHRRRGLVRAGCLPGGSLGAARAQTGGFQPGWDQLRFQEQRYDRRRERGVSRREGASPGQLRLARDRRARKAYRHGDRPGAGEVLAQDTRSALQSLKSRSQ